MPRPNQPLKPLLKRWMRPDITDVSRRTQIFLPSFRLTFIRTPLHPPNLATFRTPLFFSKLDLRDYLFRVYNVKIGRSIRSWVRQLKIVQGPSRLRSRRERIRLPQSQKYMTVELEKPFVWPKDIVKENDEEELAGFDKKQFDAFQQSKAGMDRSRNERLLAERPVQGRREALREMAERLRKGEETWKPASEFFNYAPEPTEEGEGILDVKGDKTTVEEDILNVKGDKTTVER
ncbi:MAG: hypothetical protein M1834_004201 [Cirrosporium novae-zelandiae]|nr:MAG: hypothetical protein M1834_004201 [Cirrosporium novae-zelandiae]